MSNLDYSAMLYNIRTKRNSRSRIIRDAYCTYLKCVRILVSRSQTAFTRRERVWYNAYARLVQSPPEEGGDNCIPHLASPGNRPPTGYRCCVNNRPKAHLHSATGRRYGDVLIETTLRAKHERGAVSAQQRSRLSIIRTIAHKERSSATVYAHMVRPSVVWKVK